MAKPRSKNPFARLGEWLLAKLVLTLLGAVRLLPARSAVGFGGRVAGALGPFLPVNKVAMDNLAIAFPEKSKAEHRQIAKKSWDNLGRTAVEYAFLDRIFDFDVDNPTEGHFDVEGIELFLEILESDKPCVLITGHFANWEILAVCAAAYGLELSVLFRPPNNVFLAERLDTIRGAMMGHLVASRKGAVSQLAAAMDKNKHVGLLVDQHFSRGPRIEFFGKPAHANPTFAKLARNYDAPVYAARTIRLPKGRFKLQMIGPLELPRDGEGAVDIGPSLQSAADLIEGWAREYPGQWLWMHRRWRDSKK